MEEGHPARGIPITEGEEGGLHFKKIMSTFAILDVKGLEEDVVLGNRKLNKSVVMIRN